MILLNPGPVTLSAKVRRALQGDDLCHREPEFASLTKAILGKLESVYDDAGKTHAAVLLTASGSGAVEAMLSTFAPRNQTTLVVANGVYGERMLDMLTRQGKPCIGLTAPWESPIELDSVERLLEEHPGISHLAVVHHETTTGRLNDLRALAKLCAKRRIELMIDAVSSFGAEWIDFATWNPLAIASTANKCLHGIPGVSFVMARREALEHSQTQATTLYFDLLRYYRNQRSGWSPFTQAVQGFMALEAALDELLESGSWSGRQGVYRQRSSRIAAKLGKLGALPLLEDGASSMLRSYLYPEGKSYARLHDGLKKRGFTIYAGQGRLQARIFRIATMGDITEENMQNLMAALEEVLA